MGVNYGSKFDLPELGTEQISNAPTSTKKGFISSLFSGANLYRTLISIGEIGLGLIPGLGEVGAATAIALTAAGGQTIVDATAGQGLNPLNAAINFGSALIPGVSTGVKGALNKRKIGQNIISETLKGQPNVFASITQSPELNSFKHVANNAHNISNGGGALGYGKFAPKIQSKDFIDSLGKFQGRNVWGINPKNLSKDIFSTHLANNPFIPTHLYSNSGVIHRAAAGIVFNRITLSSRGVIYGLESTENFEQRTRRTLNKSGFTNDEIDQFFRLARIDANFGEDVAQLEILNYLRSVDKLSLRRLLSRVSKFTEEDKELIRYSNRFHKALHVNQVERQYGIARRSYKYLNSAKFYDREVQWIQNAFSGADAGRFIPERIYRFLLHGSDGKFLKKWKGIEEWIDERLDKLFKKTAKKTAGTAAKTEKRLRDEFFKSGGVSLGSRYITGYKILKVPTSRFAVDGWILFRFNRTNTSGKTGKNRRGKREVIGRCSRHDIVRFNETQGSYYYWKQGRKRGWYVSRGGKAVNGAFELTEEVGTLLSFLPIQMFRSLASAFSNLNGAIRENSYGNYIDDFVKNIISTGENRAVRIGARGLLAPLANRIGGNILTKATKGVFKPKDYFGRVFQQFGTAGLAVGTHKGRKKSYTGKAIKMTFANVLEKRLQSDIRRTLRVKRPNSGVRRSMTSTRKLTITRGFVSGTGKLITGKKWFK